MRVVNMHEAKTHLSRLVEGAVQGEPFIIARAGTPLVMVASLEMPEPGAVRRTGFLPDISVPEDFDQMGGSKLQALFEGDA